MTWDLPWEGLGPDQIDSRKVKGGHLDIPSSPESLNRLPGTQQDKAAFQRVAARYTRLMKQVRWRGGGAGQSDGQCGCACQCMRWCIRGSCCRCMDGSRPNLSAPQLCVQCWSYNPRDRPDFTTIAQQLG